VTGNETPKWREFRSQPRNCRCEVEDQGGGGQKDVPEIGLGEIDSRSVRGDGKSEWRLPERNLGHHVIEPLRKALPYAKAFPPHQVVRFPNRHWR
jgi:hypothetical protein